MSPTTLDVRGGSQLAKGSAASELDRLATALRLSEGTLLSMAHEFASTCACRVRSIDDLTDGERSALIERLREIMQILSFYHVDRKLTTLGPKGLTEEGFK